MKVGVIGAGYWGPNLIRNLATIPDSPLAAVCDLSDERLGVVTRLYPGVQCTKEYRDFFGKAGIDAVVVATPAATHYSIAKDCLSHGLDVMVEKPLAMSTDQCRELIDIAEAGNRVLMVGHTFDYSPPARKLVDIATSGELGQIYYTYSQRVNLGQVRRDVNAMWNLAPHDLSIVLRVMKDSEPIEVSAHGYCYLQPGIHDVVFLNLLFSSGVAASVHVSWLDPGKVRKTTVVGSRKMVVYDDTDPDAPIRVYDKGVDRIDQEGNPVTFSSYGEFRLLVRAGDVLLPKVDVTEPLYREIGHFVECVTQRKRPFTDGLEGLRVVRILEAAQLSLESEGKIVRLAQD